MRLRISSSLSYAEKLMPQLMFYGRAGLGASSISSMVFLGMTSLDCSAGTLLPR